MTNHQNYRHINCLDIDLCVHKITYRGPKYLKIKATIFNRYNQIVYETKTFKIQRTDLINWKLA